MPIPIFAVEDGSPLISKQPLRAFPCPMVVRNIGGCGKKHFCNTRKIMLGARNKHCFIALLHSSERTIGATSHCTAVEGEAKDQVCLETLFTSQPQKSHKKTQINKSPPDKPCANMDSPSVDDTDCERRMLRLRWQKQRVLSFYPSELMPVALGVARQVRRGRDHSLDQNIPPRLWGRTSIAV